MLDGISRTSSEPWKFSKVPKNFWTNLENQRLFFDSLLQHHFRTSSQSAFYGLTREDLSRFGGLCQ